MCCVSYNTFFKHQLHIITFRVLGTETRLMMNLQPIPYKPPSPKELEAKAKKLQAGLDKVQIYLL